MGVRGLTRYIATRAELYLKPYELHDCNLVIDGDNLACNLYKSAAGKNAAFGGDYDAFYRSVVEFFHVLMECNIQAYVLMDGGYEKKKLRTVWQRLRGKIANIKRIDPSKPSHLALFPLMMREVFIDAVRDCGVPVMRCMFEADEELAALGRKLNCPVLSYDSDFYIYNVKYIPLVTLTPKAIIKRVKNNNNQTQERKLTKCNVRRLEKRTKAHQIVKGVQVSAVNDEQLKGRRSYKYLDCCLYKMENLLEGASLSKEKLPLFAALLGNDYIARSAFQTFFSQMKQMRLGRKPSKQYKRIQKILLWLRNETVESALNKILESLKKSRRHFLLMRLRAAIDGYTTECCESYDFFSSQYEMTPDTYETAEESDEEAESDEEEEQEEEQDEEDEVDQDEDEPLDEHISEDTNQVIDEADSYDEEDNYNEMEYNEDDSDDDDSESEPDLARHLPEWFKNRLYSADLSRFFVDLVHLRIYVNNPQIEHFVFHDCNEIALPILQYIFVLLHNVGGDEKNQLYHMDKKKLPGENDSEELIPYMRYLTRVPRVSNIHTVRYPIGSPPESTFDPSSPNPKLFQAIFRDLKLDSEKLFTDINQIPSDLRLYCLALIYWVHKTPHADLLHLHALLICLVVLRTIDSKVEPIRGELAFQKRFGKIIKKEKQAREKEQKEGIVREARPEIKSLPVWDRIDSISKIDCLLVQENLLKHFHMQEVFKRKYDTFSTTTLHGFSEFQSVVFTLRGLNVLLGDIYENPKIAQAFCGVFLYNIYELLRNRIDLKYFVQNYIFRQAPVMFEFYEFLWNWLSEFVPAWQKQRDLTKTISKRTLKKREAAARKKASSNDTQPVDPNAELVEKETDVEDDEEFFDLNNKFCALVMR